jgi:hypothetical protein
MTNLADTLRRHVEIMKMTKIDACRRNNGPADLVPMCVWVDGEDQTNIAIVDAKGHTSDFMPKLLSLLAKQSPKIIVFMSESLAKQVGSAKELDEFLATSKPGDLRKLYDAHGPLSGLQELIAFSALSVVTGEQMQAIAKFTYDDSGLPVFSETEMMEIPRADTDKANISWLFDKFYEFMKSSQAETN